MKKINKMSGQFFVKWILLTMLALFGATSALAASDPVAELNSVANQLINKLKQRQTTLKENPQIVYSLANKIVVPHADVGEMSRRVLPPQIWNSATPAQRAKFQREFTTLLVHTYASALANYRDQTIQFYPVRGGYQGKKTVQVDSSIERSDGPSIAVSYRLIARGSGWKLYDLSVEGVSMLESFRSQFADQLAQGNIESLTANLAAHNRS